MKVGGEENCENRKEEEIGGRSIRRKEMWKSETKVWKREKGRMRKKRKDKEKGEERTETGEEKRK